MPKPGDRVIVEGTKVGGGRREGTLVEVVGRLIRVRWEGGSETIMTPAPGAVQFLPGSSRNVARSAPPARPKAGKPGTRKPPARASKPKGRTKR